MKQHVVHKLFNTVTAAAEWMEQLGGNAIEGGAIVERIDSFQIIPVIPVGEAYVVVAVIMTRDAT